MKRFLFIGSLCLVLFSFVACENITDKNTTVTESNKRISREEDKESVTDKKKERDTTETAQSMTRDNEEKSESTNQNVDNIDTEVEEDSEKIDSDTVADDKEAENSENQYVGEYAAYDIDEPGLEIQKNSDGTYKIQIKIYRLIQLDECVGEDTGNGIAFSTAELGEKDISGIISLIDDVATVKFTGSDWKEYSDVQEYKYYKTSDVPNIYTP